MLQTLKFSYVSHLKIVLKCSLTPILNIFCFCNLFPVYNILLLRFIQNSCPCTLSHRLIIQVQSTFHFFYNIYIIWRSDDNFLGLTYYPLIDQVSFSKNISNVFMKVPVKQMEKISKRIKFKDVEVFELITDIKRLLGFPRYKSNMWKYVRLSEFILKNNIVSVWVWLCWNVRIIYVKRCQAIPIYY